MTMLFSTDCDRFLHSSSSALAQVVIYVDQDQNIMPAGVLFWVYCQSHSILTKTAPTGAWFQFITTTIRD